MSYHKEVLWYTLSGTSIHFTHSNSGIVLNFCLSGSRCKRLLLPLSSHCMFTETCRFVASVVWNRGTIFNIFLGQGWGPRLSAAHTIANWLKLKTDTWRQNIALSVVLISHVSCLCFWFSIFCTDNISWKITSYCFTSRVSLTLSLLRVINVKIPLQPHKNMTSHSMENLTFHSLLRSKIIILQILATSLIQLLFERLGEYTFWAQEWKG